MNGFFGKIMRKIVRWLDPCLEKYRTRNEKILRSPQDNTRLAAKMNAEAILTPNTADSTTAESANDLSTTGALQYDADFEPTDAFPRPPQTEAELVLMLRRTPKTILSDAERQRIASAMSFRTETIKDLILPKSKITFVHDTDMLGPLMLDKLYQSGFSHFPVLDKNNQVVGVLHTSALNSLEIKQTTIAAELLDETVYYLREDYTIEQALAAFLRTNSFFFLVVNKNGNLKGLITYRMLAEHLLGEIREEEFDGDRKLAEVLKRKL